jgi:hypothetical protein
MSMNKPEIEKIQARCAFQLASCSFLRPARPHCAEKRPRSEKIDAAHFFSPIVPIEPGALNVQVARQAVASAAF